MAIDRSEYEIRIKSTADKSGIDQVKQGIAEMTGKVEEGGKAAGDSAGGVEKLGLTHRQLHTALEQVSPSLAGMVHFLTTGVAGAVGGAVILFEFLTQKLEALKKAAEALDTGPGARGEWAVKAAENTRAAAVEAAVYEERLHALTTAQEGLAKSIDNLIESQKRQAADARTVADAEKELQLARLELAEKLGGVSHDQAVKIRLEIDDAAFKAQLEAEKAAIKAALGARQQEYETNEGKESGLNRAKEHADAAALAATNAESTNKSKLDQEKKDLADLEAAQKKLSEGIGLSDILPDWMTKHADDQSMIGILRGGPGQIDNMIAQKKKLIGQDEGKQTGLETTAALAKNQAAKAKSDYEEAAKLSRDVLETVNKLKADLAAATAKNAALEGIHHETTRVRERAADADTANRVHSGHGPAQENAAAVDRGIQDSATHETGPQAGLDAAEAVAKARTIFANTAGMQRGQADAGTMNTLHALLDQIVGFQQSHVENVQSQHGDLQSAFQELSHRISDLETAQRTSGSWNQ